MDDATPTKRETAAEDAGRAGRLVIGVGLDGPSAVALRRGLALAEALSLDPWIVHVLEPETARRDGGGQTRDAVDAQRARLARRAVQEWSLFEVGVALPRSSIHVRVGDPADELTRFARLRRVDLLLVGGRTDAAAATPGELTRTLVSRATCPVLVCGPARNDALVVATDLMDPAVPVVRTAARLATRLGRPLSIVHNVSGVTLRGTTFPLPGALAEAVVAERLDQLDRLVRDVAPRSDARLTRAPTAGDAVLRVAREQDVDLVVIGVRSSMGLTTESILTEARRSVLTVPLTS